MLKKTSLHEYHITLKAKMANFANWDMPMSYQSVKEEILSVRKNCGIFDVSHMGEFFIEGVDASKFLSFLLPSELNIEVGKAVYAPLLNHYGKILDDLIFYKLSNEKFLLCVNASNVEKDWNWISSIAKDFNGDVSLSNMTEEYSLVAIQGPKAANLLKEAIAFDASALSYYGVEQYEGYIIARTGYTGEDGFEVFGNEQLINKLWNKIIELGAMPCGLAARDTLRLEVCYPLYGQELSEDLTPYDCGLKWTIKNKENFIGKQALENSKKRYLLLKLSLERGIPRQGYDVVNAQGQKVGIVTSGTMSPHVNKGICLARIDNIESIDKENLSIIIRGKSYLANYHKKPFVAGGHI